MAKLNRLDVKGDFIHSHYLGDDYSREAVLESSIQYNEGIKKIYSKNPDKKYKILLDLRKVKLNIKNTSRKAINVVEEITSLDQTEKVAVLGDSKVQEMIVDLILKRIEEKKGNYFTDEKRAKRWLGVK